MIEAIHETIIRDIIDVAQSIKDYDVEVDGFLNRQHGRSFGSITSKAKGLVMVFPVIVSSNMTYDSAALITKAVERKAAMLLAMLFQAANITDVDNAEDFVRQFHTNLRSGKMTLDDFMATMDRFAESQIDNGKMDALAIEEYSRIKEDLSSMNFYFEENLSDYSLDEYKYVTSYMGESTLVKMVVNEDITSNAFGTDYTSQAMQTAKNYSDTIKNDHQVASNRIIDSEVKKANELVPTLLYVNFFAGDEKIETSAIVGVKAKMYVVDGEDIMNRLEIKHTDKNLLLKLIKVSSREISFFRDFIFCIDRAKIDALAQSRRGSSSKLWKILERRATKSKLRRSLSMVNDATAISTLVITQEEVEYLKKTRYIDVEDPRIITSIMDAYNLMGFVIDDSSLEIAKFLFDDGEGQYEAITYSGLEREQRDNTKKIVNLMSKMSR